MDTVKMHNDSLGYSLEIKLHLQVILNTMDAMKKYLIGLGGYSPDMQFQSQIILSRMMPRRSTKTAAVTDNTFVAVPHVARLQDRR